MTKCYSYLADNSRKGAGFRIKTLHGLCEEGKSVSSWNSQILKCPNGSSKPCTAGKTLDGAVASKSAGDVEPLQWGHRPAGQTLSTGFLQSKPEGRAWVQMGFWKATSRDPNGGVGIVGWRREMGPHPAGSPWHVKAMPRNGGGSQDLHFLPH